MIAGQVKVDISKKLRVFVFNDILIVVKDKKGLASSTERCIFAFALI